jgi:hypothetical protein
MMTSPAVARTDRPPEDWSPFAAAYGEFYHDPRWALALARTFGYRLHCLTVRDGGVVTGLLALAEVPRLVGACRLVSLPFSYAAGPLAESAGAVTLLLDAALECSRTVRAGRVEIKRVSPCAPPEPPWVRATRYSTYRLDTRPGEEAVLQRFHADSTRRGIRKAEKAGVQVRRGEGVADWRAMAELEEGTARAHGVPPPPRRFFLEACVGLQRDGITALYLASVPGAGLAAGLVVYKGPRRWIYAFGASRPGLLEQRPNHALLWAAIRDAIAAGVEFDLGRAAPEQQGLVEFKRRWGGVEVPLAYDYYPAPGGLHAADRDRGPLAWGAALWRHLPLGLTRAGSAFYRYLG